MNQETINLIFTIFLIPLLSIISKYICAYTSQKTKSLLEKTNTEIFKEYIVMAENEIIKSVNMINQTYVNTLKQNGTFDEDAQKIALQKTKEVALNNITNSVQEFLKLTIKDYDKWIETMIEHTIDGNKSEYQ